MRLANYFPWWAVEFILWLALVNGILGLINDILKLIIWLLERKS